MEIAEFIAQRLAGEERDARAAMARHSTGTWSISGLEVWDDGAAARIAGTRAWLPPAEHIARQDPAATLARVEALRALVGLHRPSRSHSDWDGELARSCWDCSRRWPCATLRHVAAIWAAHPDYDESWRP